MNNYKIEWALSLLSKYSQIVLEEDSSLTKTNMLFIIHLYHRPMIHQDQLAEMFKMNRSSVSRSIQTLTSLGYVIKDQDPSNSRANLVTLSEEGKLKYQAIMKDIMGWIGVLTRDMTEEEVQAGMQFLMKMTKNACQSLNDQNIIDLMERM